MARRGGHSPSGQRASVWRAASRDTGQPPLHTGGVAAASRPGASDRNGSRKQLSNSADFATIRRTSRVERNRPSAQLHAEQRGSDEKSLGRAAASLRRRKLLHRGAGSSARRNSI